MGAKDKETAQKELNKLVKLNELSEWKNPKLDDTMNDYSNDSFWFELEAFSLIKMPKHLELTYIQKTHKDKYYFFINQKKQ